MFWFCSLFIYLSTSLRFFFNMALCVKLSLSHLSMSLSLLLFLSVSLSLSPPVYISFSFSLSLPLSPPVCISGAGEELLGQSVEVDASGNRKLPAIGVRTWHLDDTISHFVLLLDYFALKNQPDREATTLLFPLSSLSLSPFVISSTFLSFVF